MQHLGLLFTLSLLAINLWGLMLVAGLYWRNRWFAMAVGPILAVTAVYAIECHHGLGRSLGWLGLLSTVLSVAVVAGSIFTWAPGRLGARTAALLREWRGGVCAEEARRLLRGLRRGLPVCDVVAVHLSQHRRLLREDRRFLVHLQLLHRRDDTGARRLVLSVLFDAVLQLPALRRRADGEGSAA